MAEILPAVLAENLSEIEQELEAVRGRAKAVQIDIVDGALAPNRTWPYAGEEQRGEFERLSSQEQEFPCWQDFDFQFDLMLAHPEREIEAWVAAGASALIIHARADGAAEALRMLQDKRQGDYPVQVGIALLPDASPEALAPFEGLYDFVQVMGIVKVGFQGEPFDPRTIELVRALKAENSGRIIQIDGGVSSGNARALIEAGADRLVVGSAIFKSEDPAEALAALKKEIA